MSRKPKAKRLKRPRAVVEAELSIIGDEMAETWITVLVPHFERVIADTKKCPPTDWDEGGALMIANLERIVRRARAKERVEDDAVTRVLADAGMQRGAK